MKEKVVIVTGANRGIGFEIAKGIALAGYSVVLACRDMEKGEAAREKLVTQTGNDDIYVFQLDLASFGSIRSFSDIITRKFGGIDILINNAGVFTMEPEKTSDGFERTMGVNFFGPFLLTNLLLPLFEGSDDPRIINVSSDAYKMGKISAEFIENIEKSDDLSITAYATSKQALMMFSLELADRAKGIAVNAVHPGSVKTGIWDMKGFGASVFKFFSRFTTVSPAVGARPILKLALDEDKKGVSGKYFMKEKETEVSNIDPGLRFPLWKKAKDIVGLS